MEKKQVKLTLLLGELWNSIESKRKFQLFFLIFLMLISALVEVISLGAIMPFLAVLISPEEAFQQPTIFFIANKLGLNSANVKAYQDIIQTNQRNTDVDQLEHFNKWLPEYNHVFNFFDANPKGLPCPALLPT